MTRELYPGDLILGSDGNPALDAPYTIWDDLVAGTEVTDLKLADGVTAPPVNGGGVKVADSDGERPHLRGPDGYVGRLYCDAGTDIRYEMNPDGRLDLLLVNGLADAATALANVAALQSQFDAYVLANPGGGGGGGGVDFPAIDTYMGGSMASYLLRSVGVRYRVNPTGGATSNAWEVRPTCKVCIAVGAAPMPTTAEGRQSLDLFFPLGSV